jgi:hypothetical protein
MPGPGERLRTSASPLKASATPGMTPVGFRVAYLAWLSGIPK